MLLVEKKHYPISQFGTNPESKNLRFLSVSETVNIKNTTINNNVVNGSKPKILSSNSNFRTVNVPEDVDVCIFDILENASGTYDIVIPESSVGKHIKLFFKCDQDLNDPIKVKVVSKDIFRGILLSTQTNLEVSVQNVSIKLNPEEPYPYSSPERFAYHLYPGENMINFDDDTYMNLQIDQDLKFVDVSLENFSLGEVYKNAQFTLYQGVIDDQLSTEELLGVYHSAPILLHGQSTYNLPPIPAYIINRPWFQWGLDFFSQKMLIPQDGDFAMIGAIVEEDPEEKTSGGINLEFWTDSFEKTTYSSTPTLVINITEVSVTVNADSEKYEYTFNMQDTLEDMPEWKENEKLLVFLYEAIRPASLTSLPLIEGQLVSVVIGNDGSGGFSGRFSIEKQVASPSTRNLLFTDTYYFHIRRVIYSTDYFPNWKLNLAVRPGILFTNELKDNLDMYSFFYLIWDEFLKIDIVKIKNATIQRITKDYDADFEAEIERNKDRVLDPYKNTNLTLGRSALQCLQFHQEYFKFYIEHVETEIGIFEGRIAKTEIEKLIDHGGDTPTFYDGRIYLFGFAINTNDYELLLDYHGKDEHFYIIYNNYVSTRTLNQYLKLVPTYLNCEMFNTLGIERLGFGGFDSGVFTRGAENATNLIDELYSNPLTRHILVPEDLNTVPYHETTFEKTTQSNIDYEKARIFIPYTPSSQGTVSLKENNVADLTNKLHTFKSRNLSPLGRYDIDGVSLQDIYYKNFYNDYVMQRIDIFNDYFDYIRDTVTISINNKTVTQKVSKEGMTLISRKADEIESSSLEVESYVQGRWQSTFMGPWRIEI